MLPLPVFDIVLVDRLGDIVRYWAASVILDFVYGMFSDDFGVVHRFVVFRLPGAVFCTGRRGW